ncbi:MAG: EamA family transporter [Rhodobacterales bacterium]|nr:MAG: EamA family transporter [Rhodobacterales bacterium]
MSDRARAATWMLGAVACFSTMAIAGREVSFALDTFEIMLYRSIVGLCVVVIAAAISGRLSDVTARRLDLHLIRSVAHFTGQNLWFFAVATIPLAQVFSLEFLTPIWALLLAPLVLGEAIHRRGLIAAALGFAGIVVIARPGTAALSPGLLAAAFCGIGFALSALFTRKLTRHTGITDILFWMTLTQIGFALLCAGIDGDIARPDSATAPWLLIIAFAALGAHFCLTTALSLAPAATIMPIDYLRLPLIAIVASLLYAEALDPMVFAGGALIVIGNLINLRDRSNLRGA